MKKTDKTGVVKFHKFDFRKMAMVMSLSLLFNLSAAVLSANGSELFISTWNNSSFIVELNQERVRVKGEFFTDGLAPGKHRIKILQTQVNMRTGKKRTKFLYNGFIEIPRNSRTVAVVKQNFRLQIVKRIKLKERQRTGCHQTNDYYSDHGWEEDYRCPNEYTPVMSDCDMSPTHTSSVSYCDNCNDYYVPCNQNNSSGMNCSNCCDNEPDVIECFDDGYESDYYHEEDFEYYDEMDLIMNEDAFSDLLLMLENEWFDSRKLTTAKQAIKNNTLSAEQVKRLVDTFIFESSRLDIAKYAYEYTIDKQNYYIVFSTLTYNSSVKELELWIDEMS